MERIVYDSSGQLSGSFMNFMPRADIPNLESEVAGEIANPLGVNTAYRVGCRRRLYGWARRNPARLRWQRAHAKVLQMAGCPSRLACARPVKSSCALAGMANRAST